MLPLQKHLGRHSNPQPNFLSCLYGKFLTVGICLCVCVCVCKDIYLCFEGLSDDGPVPHGVQTVPGSTHIPWRQGALWWVWLQEYQLLQPASHRVKLWLVGQQQQLVEK